MVVCSSEIVVHRLKQLKTIESGAAQFLARFWQVLVAPSFSEAPHLRNSIPHPAPEFEKKCELRPIQCFKIPWA